MPIRLTRGIKVLLIIYVVVFLIQQTGDRFLGTHLWSVLALYPPAFYDAHAVWQILTFSFLHGDVFQLFFNGLLLAFIGMELEVVMGTPKFIKYYAICTLSSAVLYLTMDLAFHFTLPLAGPGGGLYGLLMAYALLFGERVMLFMLLFPLKAKHFIWILATLELMTSIFSANGNLSALSSIGGMIAGLGYLWVQSLIRKQKAAQNLKGSVQQNLKKLKRMRASHLKLIINNKEEDLLDAESDGEDPKTWH